MWDKLKVVNVEGAIHHRTDKAILFSTSGKRDDAVWLPKSAFEIYEEDGLIVLPEQMAIDKGLV